MTAGARHLLYGTFYYSGAFSLLGRKDAAVGRRITIVTFHRVDDRDAGDPYSLPTMFISREHFRRTIGFLKAHYRIISLPDLIGTLAERREVPGHALLLTFDDGYLDVFEHAVPMLKQEGLPATVFLPTSFIDAADDTYWWDECFYLLHTAWSKGVDLTEVLRRSAGAAAGLAAVALEREPPTARARIAAAIQTLQSSAHDERRELLDTLWKRVGADRDAYLANNRIAGWEDVRKAAACGISFGSHTCSHRFLDCESPATVREELELSKESIETRLGGSVETFAYPGGKITAEVRRAVADAGYACGMTTERGINRSDDEPLTLKRINVWNGTTLGPDGSFSKPRLAYNLRRPPRRHAA